MHIHPAVSTQGDSDVSSTDDWRVFFPACQVRVVRFYVSCLLLSSSPLLLLLLNRDPRRTVFSVGPQPRPSTPSVPCRTSTTTIPAQCSLPDLNHDHPRPVFPAGPQPRPSPPSVPCRTSTTTIHAQCSLPDLNRMSEDMPDRMSEDMPDKMPWDMPGRMPEDMPDRMPEDIPDRMPEDMPERMPDRMPQNMPDRIPEDLRDNMPEDMPDRMPEDIPDRMPEDMPDRMPNRMSEDMSDRMPEDLPVRKCISVMVGITRSKVIFFWCVFFPWKQSIKTLVAIGSWLVGWNIFYFSMYWERHHPNWRSPWFFRGVGQPPTRILLTIINHIITILTINSILPTNGRSTTNQVGPWFFLTGKIYWIWIGRSPWVGKPSWSDS